MNWKLLLLGLALAGALVAGCLWLIPTRQDSVSICLLHTNDLHAQYEPFGDPAQGGAARLATVIDAVRDSTDHVLLLDAGDQFQGSLYFTVGGPDVVAAVMNELSYDAMAIGNHEFDGGPAELAQFIDETDFPVLGANIDAQASTELADKILPFTLVYFAGEPVAIFGLTSEYTSISSTPGPDIMFLDVADTARRTVQALESSGVNKIIALTHLGYETDLALAAAVPGIDIIVGGHSHTTPSDYPAVVLSTALEPVLVVTAIDWGRVLGRLDVTFDANGVIADYEGRLLPIDASAADDDAVLAILAEYQDDIDTLMTTIVGATDVALNGAREDVRAHETNLGNLICDAMLWKTEAFGTAIAIQNGGGIRASVPQGMVTMGQVLEILPYGNQITVLSLSGAQLREALDNGVSAVEDGAGRFPQLAGARFAFDPSAQPGSRVTTVEVWDSDMEAYTPLDPNGVYTLATNSYLAGGGDGYESFVAATEDFGAYETGWLLSDTLAEYLDVASPVSPAVEGRITEPAQSATTP